MSKVKRSFDDRAVALENVKVAREALKAADDELYFADEGVADALRSERRLKDVKSAITYHANELKDDVQFSTSCAKVLISAYRWNDCTDDLVIATHVADAMPWMPWKTIIKLAPISVRYTNKQAADMLRVTLEIRQELKLIQVRACDYTDAEFKEWQRIRNNQNRKIRKDATARALNKPTAEDRKAKNAAKKAYLESLALEHGISVATVRRRITDGIFPAYEACKSEGRSIPIISSASTFANDQAASAHQARSEPNTIIDDAEHPAYAALALTAAASPEQKKTPTVSDRGQLKDEYDKSIYNTPQRTLEATVATAAHTSRDMKRAAFKPSRNASIININQRREKRARLFDLASAIFGSSGDDIARRSKSGK